jgi:hypothetical protein
MESNGIGAISDIKRVESLLASKVPNGAGFALDPLALEAEGASKSPGLNLGCRSASRPIGCRMRSGQHPHAVLPAAAVTWSTPIESRPQCHASPGLR